MAARSHLSIGEVLSLLREEFPDITISKIRFLESQGLVDPERTPSGYRKFYDHDVERLRWILRQQRENFLPLKVIKGRLSEQEPEGTEVLSAEQLAWEAAATGAAARAGTPPATSTPPATAATDAAPGAGAPPSAGPGGPADEQHRHAAPDESLASAESASPATPAAPPAGRPGPQRDATQPEPNPARPEATPATPSPAAPLATPAPSPSPARPAVPPAAVEPTEGRKHATEPVRPPNQGPAGDVDSYTAAELAAAAGADLSTVKELQGFGLLQPQAGSGGTAYFDAEGLEVLRLAAAFARHGVEARHLRAWKTSAEREASLFEQVIMPLLHQRNPQARRQAGETLEELAGLGAELRAALVRHALRSIR